MGIASAATTAFVRNFTSLTNGLPLLDNVGNPISGSYAVGTYPEEFDFYSCDPTGARDGLIQFGGELNTFVFPGLIGDPNQTEDSIPKEGGSPFLGKSIYVLFGDQSSLTDSTSFAVFKVNDTFTSENALDLGVVTADVVPGNGEVVFGSRIVPSSQPEGAGVPNFNFAEGIQFVSPLAYDGCPEPSTSLLFGLAGLAFAAGRRRDAS